MKQKASQTMVDPAAKIDEQVHIGPGCVIGPDVEIGRGTILEPYVVVTGKTKIGMNNHFYSFSVIGEAPQDKKYDGEATELIIGNHNTIREHVTINRGTVLGQGVTRIGDHNLLMAGVHIAHDCCVGSQTIFANYAALAGHVVIEDYVILSGFCGVHQFCRIGAHAFLCRAALVTRDVPPFLTVAMRDDKAKPRGLNEEGMRRRQFEPETIRLLREAYRILYLSGLSLSDALTELKKTAYRSVDVQHFLCFVEGSERGIIR